jgi:hypothetical protein
VISFFGAITHEISQKYVYTALCNQLFGVIHSNSLYFSPTFTWLLSKLISSASSLRRASTSHSFVSISCFHQGKIHLSFFLTRRSFLEESIMIASITGWFISLILIIIPYCSTSLSIDLFFFEDLFFVYFTHEFNESYFELNTLLLCNIDFQWYTGESGSVHTFS